MEDEEYDATLLLSSADVGVSEKVDVASLTELVMVELYERAEDDDTSVIELAGVDELWW